jgi:8-oxo-dGTP diphosphatase
MPALPLKLSGRAVILSPAPDGGDHVLLLQRAATSTHFPSKWEFPGGKNDPGEEFADALLREVVEETGFMVELTHVLGAGEHTMADRRIAYLIVEARITGGTFRLSDEHDAFAWVPRTELPSHDLCPAFLPFARAYAAGLDQPPLFHS